MEEISKSNTEVLPSSTPPRSSSLLIVILFVLVILSLAGVGILSWQNQQMQKQINLLSSSQAVEKSPIAPMNTPTTTEPYADWNTYTNSLYGFSFKYPTHIYLVGDSQSSAILLDGKPINIQGGWGNSQATAVHIAKEATRSLPETIATCKDILVTTSIKETTLPYPLVGSRVDGIGGPGPMEDQTLSMVILELPDKLVRYRRHF